MFKKHLNRVLQTDSDFTGTVLRIFFGIVISAHGAQKLLGWFGGSGFSGTMQFFVETMGIPTILAFSVIMFEFFGGLALIAGLFTRIAVSGIGIIMIVASTVHLENGFFMNWFGNQSGEGVEYFLLAIAISLAILVKGGGKGSVDLALSKRVS